MPTDTNLPIFLIGAPRSGTKILRETLRKHPHIFGPKYELERIWCYGNMDRINMPLDLEKCTPEIADYIRTSIMKMAQRYDNKRLIVKSTLLPLRIAFFRRVFPDAPVINIIRDGRDAAISIRARYEAPLELGYMIKHWIIPPIQEFPYYLRSLISHYAKQLTQGQRAEKVWGPQFDDMAELRAKYSLLTVCGMVWNRSVMGIHENEALLRSGPYIPVRYEDFVRAPKQIIQEILDWLGLISSAELLDKMAAEIRGSDLQPWKKLGSEELRLLQEVEKEGLRIFGYLKGD